MAAVWRRLALPLLLLAAIAETQQTSSLVLEEVLEHGPLFDELEDEAWWSGVDVVDTVAQHLQEEDFCEEVACSDLLPRLPPPPPAPPALSELAKQLNQDEECLLCQWATLNGTIDLLPNSELSSENTWVPMLVVVALVSAMLGAVLMITALKCRRLKVLPRGGSCTTLPVGYMVGEGKEGVVSADLHSMDSLPKTYSVRPAEGNGAGSTLGRPRLETPTLNGSTSVSGVQKCSTVEESSWGVKLWRKFTGASNPADADQSDAMSAVYAELNSVAGSVPIYHLNTYSEIREPPPPLQHHQVAPSTLHLRRLLSDGTYENAGYALERGVILVEHDATSASTPSSAYYSDLSNPSERSGSHLWSQRQPRGSAHSLPHCCHHHYTHHQHTRSLQEQQTMRARDLMPVALQVVPDNQQVPVHYLLAGFSRGGISSSLREEAEGSCKRPLPPLPSRQVQRPQRRYAYAVDHQESTLPVENRSDSPALSCVPSEYI